MCPHTTICVLIPLCRLDWQRMPKLHVRLRICQHTQTSAYAYVSIRQHTWIDSVCQSCTSDYEYMSAYAYVSIRICQHTSAYLDWQRMPELGPCTRSRDGGTFFFFIKEYEDTYIASAYYYMCPHTTVHVSSYYSICPHTTTYVSSYYSICPL